MTPVYRHILANAKTPNRMHFSLADSSRLD